MEIETEIEIDENLSFIEANLIELELNELEVLIW